jgi:L-seryl-tRNA(Ser) seleniumtransferase
VSEGFRALPSVDVLARAVEDGRTPHALAVDAARHVLAAARAEVANGANTPTFDELGERTRRAVEEARRGSLRAVINATGVILQTNLGRAPLSERALAAVERVSRGYSNLEFDLHEGARGSRHEHVRDLLRRATGAADGIVVNNNAAALLMVLQVFARGREVIVSRGQAVEIGGGFRIPDVLRQSGARLVEVGTTNRTYVADYADAITSETAAILRVHPSNFRVIGFTAEPGLEELAALARERDVLLLDDLGSGCLLETRQFGMAHEPMVQESVSGGADLAMFSGDKLLGGPQAGIIVGRGDLVSALRRHPLARALRVDRMTIAALNATLLAYVEGTATGELPIWRMLAMPLAAVRRRARRWAAAAAGQASVVRSRSMVGGGSLPGEGVETWCCGGRRQSAAGSRRSSGGWMAASSCSTRGRSTRRTTRWWRRRSRPPVVNHIRNVRALPGSYDGSTVGVLRISQWRLRSPKS